MQVERQLACIRQGEGTQVIDQSDEELRLREQQVNFAFAVRYDVLFKQLEPDLYGAQRGSQVVSNAGNHIAALAFIGLKRARHLIKVLRQGDDLYVVKPFRVGYARPEVTLSNLYRRVAYLFDSMGLASALAATLANTLATSTKCSY